MIELILDTIKIQLRDQVPVCFFRIGAPDKANGLLDRAFFPGMVRLTKKERVPRAWLADAWRAFCIFRADLEGNLRILTKRFFRSTMTAVAPLLWLETAVSASQWPDSWRELAKSERFSRGVRLGILEACLYLAEPLFLRLWAGTARYFTLLQLGWFRVHSQLMVLTLRLIMIK